MLRCRPRLPAILSLVTISMALAAPTYAKTIYASGDWSLDDSQPGVAGKGTCVAATATYLGNYGVYSLNVVLDKTGAHPLEVMIRPFKSPSKVNRFQVTTQAGRTYTFVKLQPTAKGEETFWNVPRGTDKLVAEMKGVNQLNVDAVNGLGELPFSMSGSTAVLSQLERRCAVSPALNSAQFEAAFLPKEVNSIDYAKIDQARASLLRDLVAKGVAAYHHIDDMNAALAALEAHYADLNREKATLTAALDQLSNRDLPSTTKASVNAQAAIDNAIADIASLKEQIAAQQALLVTATAAYDTAYATLKPFVPEHDRLEGIMRGDMSRQSGAESNLASAEQSLASKNQELTDRNDELNNTRFGLDRLQEDMRRARWQLSGAESALRAFDPSWEIRRRTDSDGRLRSLDAEISSLTQNVNSLQQQVSAAQSDRAARDQAVRACEGGRSANALELLVNRALASEDGRAGWAGRAGFGGQGGGFPGRGDHGGPGGPGTAPTPPAPPAPTPVPPPPAPVPVTPPPAPTPPPSPAPTAPDCSAQRAALAQADQRLGSLQQSLAQAQNQLQARSFERDNVARQIAADVYQQREELVRREAEARRFVTVLENRRDQMESRVRDLSAFVIPGIQNEIANLTSQRNSSATELESARQALARSTSAYNAYKASVNYDALESDVHRTAGRVSEIKGTISSLNSSVADRERLIREQTALRDSLDKRIADLNRTIAQKTSRLAEVNSLLVPYVSDRKAADDKISEAKQGLGAVTAELAGQLPLKK